MKSQAPKQTVPVVPAVSAQPVQPAETVKNFACVACGNENVQKVTAIHQGGTWSASSSGSSTSAAFVGHGNVVPIMGSTSTKTSGTSNLARLLAPPTQPTKSDPLALILTAIILAPFIIVFALNGMDMIFYTGVVAAFEAAIVSKAVKHYRQSKTFSPDDENWRSAMHRWNQLFYCCVAIRYTIRKPGNMRRATTWLRCCDI